MFNRQTSSPKSETRDYEQFFTKELSKNKFPFLNILCCAFFLIAHNFFSYFLFIVLET